uniref:MD-2-related lipid-recognition domain-containing protein n=1 Tax=Heliothis virescens TaxID=7102 RepID=A0A2A4JC51_HELVI
MYRFVLFCALVALVKANTTQVSQCVNHNGALPANTHIEGCTTPPCALPQLQDAVIHLDFQAPRAIQSMRTLATAYLGFIPVPYDLGEKSQTCNFLSNASCPVSANQSLQYTLRMPIEPFFPVGIQVNIEFRVVDENNGALVCLRVPIRIAPPVVA